MKSFAKTLTTSLFGTLIAGATAMAQTVAIDYDHAVNFSKYKSYTLQKVHATDPGVESRLTIAIDRDMLTRYLHPQDKNADLIVAVVESDTDVQEYSKFYDDMGALSWQRGWGSGGFLDSHATLQDIPAGTLVLDMWDSKTGKLVWRGTVGESIQGGGNKNDDKMDKAVGKLLGQYPPKYQKP